MYYGAHMNSDEEYIDSNILQLIKDGRAIGANCVQVFLRNPNNTRKDGIRPFDKKIAKKVKEYLKKYKMKLFIHCSYMANLGVPPVHQFKYRSELVIDDLKKSSKLGAKGVVLHLGTRNNSKLGLLTQEETYKNFVKSIKYILDNTPKSSVLILETSAGDGSKIGGLLDDFADIYKRCLRGIKPEQRKRLKICLDTCHIFVAGNDIKTTESWREYLIKFNYLIGLKNIVLIHLNDSKVPFGDKKDRHEALEEGYLFNPKMGGNRKVLETIILTAKVRKIPLILETHGEYDEEIKLIASIMKGGVKKLKIVKTDYKDIILKNLGELMEIRKATGNSFRARSYGKVIREINKMDKPINTINDLDGIKGIGKSIRAKIEEIIKTGKLKQLIDLKKEQGKKVKALDELQGIMGIGPTMAKTLYKKGITTIPKLKRAVKRGDIELNETQMVGLEYYNELRKKVLRSETKKTAEKLQKLVMKLYPGAKIHIAGSYRTGKKQSKDMDFILTIPEIVSKKDIKPKYLRSIMEEISKKHDLVYQISLGSNTSMFLIRQNGNIRHIDLKLSSLDTLVEHMFYFASGAEFNRRIRAIAKNKGYKLSEWGLFKQGGKRVFIPKTERDIFTFLKVPYETPRKRYEPKL